MGENIMNDYTNTWGKFMENLTSPKEYYELTFDEVMAMINEHYVQNYLGEVSNSEEWVEKWLKENLNH